jgi:ankyrin repeat protein
MAKKYVFEDELLAAAQDGRQEDIQRILDSGNAHVDCIDNNRNTSLIFAASCGHLEICKLLRIKV